MFFLLRRLTVLVVTLLLVSFLVFLVPFITPGDPVRKILRARTGQLDLDPAQVERLRVEYGLDRPMLEQYVEWLGRAFTGDLGISYTSRAPALDMIGGALGVTATLAVVALLFALAVALPLGALAAARRGRTADTVVTSISQAFVAIPEYWMGPVLVLIFALGMGVLPSAGWAGPSSMILPCLVLSLRPMSYFTQVARASMVDVLESPHFLAARSRGLSFAQTMLHHGLRNSLLPVVTLFSIWLAGLLGGSVVIEVIFAIPGMGRLLFESVTNGDTPVMQAAIVMIVGLTVLITTLTDVLYALINPTVRSANVSS
ncbi:ABC transporter permease [Ruania alba]|uniref:Peptide/nickel transport system permease protein n=1 Tax=Ruania alba TaxID=648782 RepID=A0A1H5HP23_9MICO|nr:ABC transporter permease [Ruania alba]SEE29524.1 peptide/nickel transport system permease protein [Ruania alba]